MGIRKTGRILIFISFLAISSVVGHESDGSCGVSSHGHHDEHHHHHLSCDHEHEEKNGLGFMLPEEIAEEEDMISDCHLHSHDHSHEVKRLVDAPDLTTLGLWIHAMGCSLLVSMASLVCLIMLPLFILKGKPSKMLVDSLAAFGAGAMLGDSFLHQLPHAFGGGHSHSQDHHADHAHAHEHHHEDGQSHAHSLADLSVGLSVLSGIVLFLLVERLVRYVEGASGNWSGHSHHHHHLRNSGSKVKDDGGNSEDQKQMSVEKNENKITDKNLNDANDNKHETPRKRRSAKVNGDKKHNGGSPISSTEIVETKGEESLKQGSDLVFGYLNLFSDGVHNFTDGMALGSAFLLYGSVGGWSRTLFLLAHELPQEVGDFGILVRSGFSVIHALFFNFLSALVALAGTALALILGKDPGHSALIEGFTAGGFIYIAVAGVLPEISSGNSSLKSTALQVVFLVLGMSVALGISLLE